jgi:uncharacterized protein
MMLNDPTFFYLHGFASGPRSTKARDLAARFAGINRILHIPDLNQGDFTHLTLSRQLHQVKTLLPSTGPVTLIGSSLGGLTAAWVGQQVEQVDRLLLLAPAFNFLDHWSQLIGSAQMQNWQAGQPLSVYHYSEQRCLPLDYQFVIDLKQYADRDLQRPVPTMIIHGQRDQVIPIQASRDYAATRAWVTLLELDSDHGLLDVGDQIWQQLQQFCQLHPRDTL